MEEETEIVWIEFAMALAVIGLMIVLAWGFGL